MIFLTFNDETGAFIDVECVKGCMGAPDNNHGMNAVIVDCDGHQFYSPLSCAEIRGRIESILGKALH
jgi:hypothetical protein